ncbi:Homeobox-leucine zipper protein ATHB-21 [Hibiscus syriacus]|uniref:Homeobox-leucine zipper protein n=1 Tax=Hibiscus syriacus TaxID=106335 RepID=A0A6A2Y5U3_HIBSY|nr:homeobox-leucine zipper protein ATHB-40-like [Hibiscus syriacus]KAE8665927.1 Homeobox-leucine zipper protein ATHB-21 [Hibiscus syriacus]
MNKQEDQMALISPLYSGVYSQIAPQQAESKPRRRRKKNKGGENSLSGFRKRKLTQEQVDVLELNFGNEHKLESEKKERLASELGLDPRQVAVWFQNRRTRWKNKKIVEELSKLQSAHDGFVLEKCRLESEVIKLKEKLCEAEKEIQRLRERVDGGASNSPISSLTMEAMDTHLLGEFGGYEEAFYMADNSYNIPGMEWMNLFM